MTEQLTTIEQAKNAYDVALAAANDALKASPVNREGYDEAIKQLKAAEDAYAKFSAEQLYEECAKLENPIVELVKRYAYPTIGHKEATNDDGVVVSCEPTEKERQVDLLKFCKMAKLDTDWQYPVSRFNQLMCLRVAKAIGVNPNDIAKTYYLKQKVREIDMGGTPTSNTQVCKLLQALINDILPNEDEDGSLIYKCNNHDVTYLDNVYAKKDAKTRLTLRVSNDSFLRRILVDIMYRLVTNSHYSVDGFKRVKA